MDKTPGPCPSTALGQKGKLKSSFGTTNIGVWGKHCTKENAEGVFGRAEWFLPGKLHLALKERLECSWDGAAPKRLNHPKKQCWGLGQALFLPLGKWMLKAGP